MRRVLEAAVIASVATPIVVGLLNAPAIRAQNSTDWQAKAGGKMAFQVASIKPGKGAYDPSNASLTPWDDYAPAGGHFRADASLLTYIEFAYKLWPNDPQSREFAHLPKWVASDPYSIEARADTANPTKDQMRLMVQSLLADRFQLAAHFEAREVPAFALKLAKTGKLGPRLVSHSEGPPCDKPGPSPGDGLPGFPCHSLMAFDRPGTKLILMGSRDVTMDVLAGAFSASRDFGRGRTVIDETGLTGRFDFTLELVPERRALAASDSSVPSVPDGPAPLEALRDQLGLKLEPEKATLPILMIDRVQRPSEN
jgi:bla regulator protein blaR1